jgi:hypothetical protein
LIVLPSEAGVRSINTDAYDASGKGAVNSAGAGHLAIEDDGEEVV